MFAILLLAAVVAARIAGPSDSYDHSQPKTMAYTTDILVHIGDWRHWVLPIERGELPATKPPLYNWLAAPCVWALGFSSEIGHKLPSLAALAVCWLLVVRLGRGAFAQSGIGWLAGSVMLLNHSMFKQGYLARPDMLLALWMLTGWIAATSIFLSTEFERHQFRSRRILFWLSVALAGLTKGPVAALLLLYGLIGARVLTGRWSSTSRLGWWTGLPLALAPEAAWLFLCWKIDPVHVQDQLWSAEFVGRVAGTGPEGSHLGPTGMIRQLPYAAFYFVTRLAPWSALAVAAWVMLRKRRATSIERAGAPGQERRWLIGATAFTLLTIGFFTLGASRRPDYVAVAFPQASLLAAWCLCSLLNRSSNWGSVAVKAALAMMLLGLALFDRVAPSDPSATFGRDIHRFIMQADREISAGPRPMAFFATGQTQCKAMLGFSEPDSESKVRGLAAGGEAFHLLAGWLHNYEDGGAQRLHKMVAPMELRPLVVSPQLPRTHGWPAVMTLFEVVPADR